MPEKWPGYEVPLKSPWRRQEGSRRRAKPRADKILTCSTRSPLRRSHQEVFQMHGVVAPTCLLLGSGLCRANTFPTANALSTKRVITCEDPDNVHHLSCETGVIIVESVLYGRQNSKTCSDRRPESQQGYMYCSQRGALETLKTKCNGRKVCEVNAKLFQTGDPCYGTKKYIDTTYSCFPAVHTVACESSETNLQCDEGRVISVIGAYYGRTDPTTCSFQRPSSQVRNVDCLRPSMEVAASCNGRTSCSVKVANSLFGDPCYGTYKYLEVAHTCE